MSNFLSLFLFHDRNSRLWFTLCVDLIYLANEYKLICLLFEVRRVAHMAKVKEIKRHIWQNLSKKVSRLTRHLVIPYNWYLICFLGWWLNEKYHTSHTRERVLSFQHSILR
ncbi:hypothetical protein RHMOL_Rhmol10G0263500 [Rhododendron molle]|uniref:Uncharacterized protein n=1 Tax=Rhododendron molle TaxID=49168 RepID=A0ACC0M7N6_RHOML|nr:hypothetical protein RHMOL_Rhmol10G0263500 [Rhododendron molle]